MYNTVTEAWDDGFKVWSKQQPLSDINVPLEKQEQHLE